MTSRREFLQISMAAAVAGQSVPRGILAGEQTGTSGRYRAIEVLFDNRIPESCTFAGRAASMGLAVHGMPEGDISHFWYRHLQPLWQKNPSPVMGLTTQGPLFCLEQLSATYGLRVVFRASHHSHSPHQLTVSGPEALVQACGRLEASSPWEKALAEVMATCPSGLSEMAETTLDTGKTVFNSTPGLEHGALIAWLIAPATRKV